MSIEIRPLLMKVAWQRPDLGLDGRLWYALQEAVRDVCRRTRLARVTTENTLTANTNNLVPAILTEDEQDATPQPQRKRLRYHRVEVQSLTDDTLWTDLIEAPATDVEAFQNLRWGTGATPRNFAQRGDTLLVWPKCSVDRVLRVTTSYVPQDELDTAPLPELAVPAVEAAARSMVLLLPGSGRDPQAASEAEEEMHRCMPELRSFADDGESGPPVLRVRRFPGAP
jgi:hypothetical protein